MNHLLRLFTTAQALQGARNPRTEMGGISLIPQAQEFAKALGDAMIEGVPAETAVEEVMKALGGNETHAMELLEAVQEIAKAHVEQHTRTLANGKTVNVHAYQNKRTEAMKATANAHGSTLHAMQVKSPEAHDNAAAMHQQAAEEHGEAHKLHPADVEGVGEEHKRLQGQHHMSVVYHQSEAKRMRDESEYGKASGKAQAISGEANKDHENPRTSAFAHRSAAEAHAKAAGMKAGAGHEDKAAEHTAKGEAIEAATKAQYSPHAMGEARQEVGEAVKASTAAKDATFHAHQEGTPEAHGKAAALHGAAVEQHMAIHGEHEDDEDGHHGQIAQAHMRLHAHHTKLAAPKTEEPVAKGEGCMTSMGGGTDIAKKEGGAALAVEGKPDDELADGTIGADEVAKGHVEGHTRTIGGKVVHVHPYETIASAAAVPSKAHALAMGYTTETQNKALKARDLSTSAYHASIKAAQNGTHADAAQKHLDASEAHASIGYQNRELADEHLRLAKEHDGHAKGANEVTAADHSMAAMEKTSGFHGNDRAGQATRDAHESTMRAAATGSARQHGQAFNRHKEAAAAHEKSLAENKFDLSQENLDNHKAIIGHHHDAADWHLNQSRALKNSEYDEHAKNSHKFSSMARANAAGTYGKGVTNPAHEATMKAWSDKTAESHRAAAVLHNKAGDHYEKRGEQDGWGTSSGVHNERQRDHHRAAARAHTAAASRAPETVAKAQVAAHTRIVGGKVVHVGTYDDKRAAAHAASAAAHEATMNATTKTAHMNAAVLHGKAIAAHQEAQNTTTHEGRQMMHGANVSEHGDMVNAHRAMATAGGGQDKPLQARAASNLAPDVESVKPGEEDAAIAAHDRAGSAHVSAMDVAGADRGHHSATADIHAQDAGKIKARKEQAAREAGQNIGSGIAAHDAHTQEVASKFPQGSTVKDRFGKTHTVHSVNGSMVKTTNGDEFHHTKVFPQVAKAEKEKPEPKAKKAKDGKEEKDEAATGVQISDYESHKKAAELLSEAANRDWADDHKGAVGAHTAARDMHKKARDLAVEGDTEAFKLHDTKAWAHADRINDHHKAIAKKAEEELNPKKKK